MGPRSTTGRLSVVALALGLTGACGESPPPALVIDGLHFAASSTLPGKPPPDVDVTLTDAAPARAIYAATLELPPYPAGAVNCPADLGIRYTIDFMTGADRPTRAVISPTGCGEVMVTGAQTRQAKDGAYWSTLALNLGIDEATIYPVPTP